MATEATPAPVATEKAWTPKSKEGEGGGGGTYATMTTSSAKAGLRWYAAHGLACHPQNTHSAFVSQSQIWGIDRSEKGEMEGSSRIRRTGLGPPPGQGAAAGPAACRWPSPLLQAETPRSSATVLMLAHWWVGVFRICSGEYDEEWKLEMLLPRSWTEGPAAAGRCGRAGVVVSLANQHREV
jgi:hypothetical protein